jgi:hypothetical protein
LRLSVEKFVSSCDDEDDDDEDEEEEMGSKMK